MGFWKQEISALCVIGTAKNRESAAEGCREGQRNCHGTKSPQRSLFRKFRTGYAGRKLFQSLVAEGRAQLGGLVLVLACAATRLLMGSFKQELLGGDAISESRIRTREKRGSSQSPPASREDSGTLLEGSKVGGVEDLEVRGGVQLFRVMSIWSKK